MAKEVVKTTASTFIAFDPKAVSLVVSIEEITPHPKRAHDSDKGKSKIDSNVWDDTATAMGRAHNVVTPDKWKSLNVVPPHKMLCRHIHKLAQVLFYPNLFSSQFSWFLETIPILLILFS